MNSKSRPVAWAMWMIASIFYAYQYILRVMPNIMLEDIMHKFDMNTATFGQYSGIYYIGYSLIHIPVGIMLDRFGPKKIMSGCIIMTVIGTLPLIFAEHWFYPIVGRILIGIGSSAAILGVFKVIRMGFSDKYFARMLSIAVTIGLIGAIYGGSPVHYMLEKFGYQVFIISFALVGIILSVASYLIIPDIPKSEQKNSIISDIKEVLYNKKVTLTCIFAGLLVGPLEGFADVWGTIFFKKAYGFDTTLSTSLPSMLYVGMCFGSPVLNFIAERTRNYLITIVGAGLCMIIGFFALIFYNLGPETISISFIIMGVCCAYQILAIYKASTYVKSNVAGLTTALANMIIMIFGYIFHSIIGYVINLVGGPSSKEAIVFGIISIPLAACIGTIGFMYLYAKEKVNYQIEMA